MSASLVVPLDFKLQTGGIITPGKGPALLKSAWQRLVSKSSTDVEQIGVSDIKKCGRATFFSSKGSLRVFFRICEFTTGRSVYNCTCVERVVEQRHDSTYPSSLLLG